MFSYLWNSLLSCLLCLTWFSSLFVSGSLSLPYFQVLIPFWAFFALQTFFSRYFHYPVISTLLVYFFFICCLSKPYAHLPLDLGYIQHYSIRLVQDPTYFFFLQISPSSRHSYTWISGYFSQVLGSKSWGHFYFLLSCIKKVYRLWNWARHYSYNDE